MSDIEWTTDKPRTYGLYWVSYKNTLYGGDGVWQNVRLRWLRPDSTWTVGMCARSTRTAKQIPAPPSDSDILTNGQMRFD
jgi:hypothetical protein